MNIRTQIARLLEADFRRKIVIPLLKALGAFATEDFHGPSEKGKDVYFAYEDIFGENKHCCFFIKIGDVKKSGKNDVRNMKGAIEEAVQREFISPLDNRTSIYIEEFYFLCSGKVNQDARAFISEHLRKRQMPNFKIFDIDKLIETILKLITRYNGILGSNYTFSTRTFENYCNKIIEYEQRKLVISLRPIPSARSHSEGKVVKNP